MEGEIAKKKSILKNILNKKNQSKEGQPNLTNKEIKGVKLKKITISWIIPNKRNDNKKKRTQMYKKNKLKSWFENLKGQHGNRGWERDEEKKGHWRQTRMESRKGRLCSDNNSCATQKENELPTC